MEEMATWERRWIELRVEARDSEKRTISGYAAKFNKLSRNLGGYVETLASTVFNRSRGQDWPDVVARFNHDDNLMLGSTAAGTLRLFIDETGLRYDVDVPETRGDVYELVQRGDIRHSSFAFKFGAEDEWSTTDQGYPLRTLRSVTLRDVAPVSAIPAYPDATAGLRSLARHFECEYDEVRKLAEADELRRFFTRSDKPQQKVPELGASARVAILERRQDPLES